MLVVVADCVVLDKELAVLWLDRVVVSDDKVLTLVVVAD